MSDLIRWIRGRLTLNDKAFSSKLDLYYERFKQDYPLMMSSDTKQETMNKINECLNKNVKVQNLYPKIFGSLKGKLN